MIDCPSKTRRMVAACMLLVVMAFMADLSARAATTNCDKRDCVVVTASDLTTDTANGGCWLTAWFPPNNSFTGQAYGTFFADSGYGQDAVGGMPITEIMFGSYRNCNGTNDCSFAAGTAKLPVSGTVTKFVGMLVENQTYKTSCNGAHY